MPNNFHYINNRHVFSTNSFRFFFEFDKMFFKWHLNFNFEGGFYG
ncbi:hypothetical protein OMAG_002844 [Candidatus Omnitrophus magneticus]|uniref:Uncharacterized protein n=1 Tax=Candidatus Omnitrophus magneticus TaxID=1609969 RepID=A0A0F0CPE9_9BACT|nr:hypothetical protein OMAG_002844 [Candidatus Omnitrophus magneticus]